MSATAPAQAEGPSSGDLASRNVQRRAVEAVIWGMSGVNYDLMRQEMLRKTDAKVNQFLFWGRPLDWHNQTLTPNPDTLYFMAFLDTREVGPLVLDIPPANGGSLNARGAEREPEPVAGRVKAIWPGARIRVVNDLSAAGYGFLRHAHDDACIVTVSSGIGHKVFLDGKPAIGPSGRGGEIGHLRVDFSEEAPLCECGARGHLGALACGRAVPEQAVRLARRDPGAFARSSLAAPVAGQARRVDSHLVARTFKAGDPWAMALVGVLAAPLGQALAGIHAAVGVERFVIMGGFAQALGPAYLALVGQAAAASTWDFGQVWGRMLELGEMGDDAGLIGAGRLAARE
ncbi:ROK family protein [Methylobacterium tarhaniae]|uniref:ROK family protein n=1 Tax=Methylobacterium tarhaniae TaxID=1187852 RepID=UPI003D0765B3